MSLTLELISYFLPFKSRPKPVSRSRATYMSRKILRNQSFFYLFFVSSKGNGGGGELCVCILCGMKTFYVIENNFLKHNFRINYCMVAHDSPHLQECVHSIHAILTRSIDILVLLLKKRNRHSNVQKFSDKFNRY